MLLFEHSKRFFTGVRDLYEVLLQREAMADNLMNQHRIVRKNNRSPSLRLRFGRRSDPAMFQVSETNNSIDFNRESYLGIGQRR